LVFGRLSASSPPPLSPDFARPSPNSPGGCGDPCVDPGPRASAGAAGGSPEVAGSAAAWVTSSVVSPSAGILHTATSVRLSAPPEMAKVSPSADALGRRGTREAER
jgi:hypothetical protein